MRRQIIAGIIAAAAITGAVTACGTTTTVIKPVAATSAAPTFSAHAVSVRGCTALARWEVAAPATGPESDVSTSATVSQIVTASAGTEFGSDLSMWVNDIQDGAVPQQIDQDSTAVIADCELAGVPNVLGTA